MITHTAPKYEYLPNEDIEKIHDTTMRVLEEFGIAFNHDQAVDILERAGCEVDRDALPAPLVKFPRGFIAEQIAKAPSEFTIYARNPANNIILGGNHMVLAPVYGPPNVQDLDKGRREATLEDYRNFVKLAQVVPDMHNAGGTVVEPNDEPQETRHLDMIYSLLTLSDKTFMGNVVSAENAQDTLEMASIVFGGREVLANKPVMISLVNVNSPRLYDTRMLDALLTYAQARQPLIITPFILAGAMSPVAVGGTLVQQNAEALAGIALTQLINPGTPVVYGSFLSNSDMQSGSPAFGTPESAAALFVSAQLARKYKLPFRSGGGLTSSKAPDGQAMWEATMTFWPTFLACTNFVLHAAGWLESGLVSSYEKFAMDVELVRMMQVFLAGIPLDEEGLALDAFEEIGPGGYFFGAAHTMRHFRDAFYRPIIADVQNYVRWEQKGAETSDVRANRVWKKWLNEYQKPPIDSAIEEALQEYAAHRKREIQAAIEA
ncbi:MAG TPA: trimethylamine methyltransferase family protein [Anaerolineae bacterium]|nr:trimethylamine methyltransferase family protein [Anaerolineae bacterium]